MILNLFFLLIATIGVIVLIKVPAIATIVAMLLINF